ncbi:hypothetical protein [Methyloterricola oryzae]|uniref:hypothetical protein n=1 Tax=Methyloterricola oryzae TaxID=1495050 RepID=UPI0011AEF6D6|nr:hypothetical protein [Methyloterricola oryzae]
MIGTYRSRQYLASVLITGLLHPAMAAKCNPGPIPTSWATQSTPVPYTPTAEPNAITLILFRHGEKKLLPNGRFLENGNMSEVGRKRAQRLPARLQGMFGCPDYLVAPNPSSKISGGENTFYYYERPAGTIEPTAASLSYPLWMPYSAIETPSLSDDLLTAPEFSPSSPSTPRKIFIAWEHENILVLTHHLLTQWKLNALPEGESMKANQKAYQCQSIPTRWDGCDYDSIWVFNIQGNNLCYTHLHEHLNNPSYQKSCKKAERGTLASH